jgi:hypothetical protein
VPEPTPDPPAPPPPRRADRPELIDAADGPCPHCADWAAGKSRPGVAARHCDGCGGPIPPYAAMQGQGFQAPRPHHFHVRGVGPAGQAGREAVFQELCWACYGAAFDRAYPGAPSRPREPAKAAAE